MKKNIRKRILTGIAALLVVLAILFAGAWWFASRQLAGLDAHKDTILKIMREALDREVTYETGQASLTVRHGLSIDFTHLTVWENDGSSELFQIESAAFRVDLLPLLVRRVVLRKTVLNNPRLFLRRAPDGLLNIADLLTSETKYEMSLGLKNVVIENGEVSFTDYTRGEKGLKTSLDGLQCRIVPRRFRSGSRFKISALIHENESSGSLLAAGTFSPASSGKSLMDSKLEAFVRLTGLDLRHYVSYLGDYVSIAGLAGRLDGEIKISGTASRFNAEGKIALKDAMLDYPDVFEKTLRPGLVQLQYQIRRNGGELQLEVPSMTVDRVSLAGRFSVSGMGEDDPFLSASANSSFFSLTEMRSYIPWKIIHEPVGDFIKEHVTGGNFSLAEGKLAGRLSQITGMMEEENAGVLRVRAHVQEGVFTIGAAGVPDFTNVRGVLELKNRQFSLTGMEGRFGSSEFRLDGSISDFAAPGPVVYTAKMFLEPARDEVFWLMGRENVSGFAFDGVSSLSVSGSGPAENFQIDAAWDLTGVAYRYGEVLEKPGGHHNRLAVSLIINEDKLKVPSFEFDLEGQKLGGSAVYNFSGKSPLSLVLKSEHVDIHRIASFLPGLKKIDPAGRGMISLSGRGDPGTPAEFLWRGTVSFDNISFKPADGMERVRGLTGVATFKDGGMQTSRLEALVGQSTVKGLCRMRKLGGRDFFCRLETPLADTADFGLTGDDRGIKLRDVQARFTVGADRLRIWRFSFAAGKSVFVFSGEVPYRENAAVKLNLRSAFIHSDDAFALTGLGYVKDSGGQSSERSLNLSLQVDKGVAGGIDFSKLETRINYAGDVVDIESLAAEVLEGRLRGTGRVDLHSDGPHRYRFDFSLEQAEMEKLLEHFDVGDRLVTGKVSLIGDVSAAGATFDEFIRTAEGSCRLQADRGVIKKFSVLAKIFSLLNVAQLFKLKLPDMAAEGMPYTAVTSVFEIKEGVLNVQDLFVSGEAMQISLVGKTDLVGRKLDGIVGVHPLKTLDLIAARIPVAGWVLTDEKGNLVTVHFKVQGDWDNPEVRPIPVKSLSRGTMNVFRRVFELPEKLITDTGDVILGR